MYQNYRNFDVVEVQIMGIYLLKSLIWSGRGYFLYSACLHAYVNKNLFKVQRLTNKRDRLQYIYLPETGISINDCSERKIVFQSLSWFSISLILSFALYPRVELITNNLNIWTTEKNQNRSTFKNCKNKHRYLKIMTKENNLKHLAWLAGAESKF